MASLITVLCLSCDSGIMSCDSGSGSCDSGIGTCDSGSGSYDSGIGSCDSYNSLLFETTNGVLAFVMILLLDSSLG